MVELTTYHAAKPVASADSTAANEEKRTAAEKVFYPFHPFFILLTKVRLSQHCIKYQLFPEPCSEF